MWATRDTYGNSMKWHIADPASVQEYKQQSWRGESQHMRVDITCGGKEENRYTLGDAKVKETINIYQNNVCSYCRTFKLKEAGVTDTRLVL